MQLRSLVVAASALVLLTACMSHTRTITTGNGTATVTTNGNNSTVTVKTAQGTGTFGANAVDLKSLGLPIYPGAQASNTGYSAQSTTGSGSVVVMSTTDPFDKVYAWYKSQMPASSEQTHVTSAGGSMAAFQVGKDTDKVQKMVEISEHNGTTSIMLTSATKP
jgi:hypothetical protein